MKLRHKAACAGVLAALAVAAGPPAAQAAEVTVNPFVCSLNGGSMTVAAGSQITVRQGFSEQTRGILTAFLNAQTSTLALNGASADVTDAFSSPAQRPTGDYASFVTYPTGTTLATGSSLSVVWRTTLDHLVPEVFNPAADGPPGKPAFNPAGSVEWTCTVTAA